MKIGLSILSYKSAGSRTYIKNLLPKILEIDRENHYFLFVDTRLDLSDLQNYPNLTIIRFNISPPNLFIRFFYEQLILPIKLYFMGIDVLYCPTDMGCILSPCNIVLAIRNPNPYFNYNRIKWTRLNKIKFKIQKFLTWLSTKKAKKVIFVSNFSKYIIRKQLNIPPQKTFTVYHGVDANIFRNPQKVDKQFKERIDELKEYILSVSTIYPHKNYEVLIKAYSRLPKNIKDKYTLVIAGGISSPTLYFQKLEGMVRKLDIKDRVVFLGEVAYGNMPYLYQRASVFVLPSILETFGHTLIEAMAAGIPIIASDSTAIPEITNNAALLFDPHNPDELAYKICQVLNNKALSSNLVSKGF
ncbi:MAG: hypothetical protein DRP84_08245, partial [Spirochaetes bacterium]